MGTKATGSVRIVAGKFEARVRVAAGKRETFKLSAARTEAEALERARVLAEVATRLRRARVPVEEIGDTLRLAAAATPKTLASLLAVVTERAGGESKPVAATASNVPTFGEIAGQWVKGDLARKYPGHIKAKRSADDDESRLRLHILPKLGPLPIDAITLDDCEGVMHALPESMAVATRRNVGQLITRIFSMAVYPLRLIERSPLPPKFLPAAPEQAQHSFLYPSEDRTLLQHTGCPLVYRILFGVLSREGCRLSEALELCWRDLDLERGAIQLGRTKTDNGRTWKLDAGVIIALRRYRELCAGHNADSDRVFLDGGRPIVGSGALGIPALLRAWLLKAGVTRSALHETSTDKSKRRLRAHDLRASFITIALANGATETYVQDRTGHKSSAMVNRYRRSARTAAELQLGTWTALHEAVPELTSGPRVAHRIEIHLETGRPQRDLKTSGGQPNTAEPQELSEKAGSSCAPSSPIVGAMGQSWATPEAAELRELRADLKRAVLDGRNAVARALAQEIDRLEAASAAGVVQLDTARAKRRGQP